MSNSDRGAKGPTTDIVTTSSKLTDIKLDGDGENYVEGKYLVEVSLGGMGREDHLIETCTDGSKEAMWNTEDKRILALLVNSVDRRTQFVITHYGIF